MLEICFKIFHMIGMAGQTGGPGRERLSVAETAATDTNIVVIAAAHTRSNSCLSHW